MKQRPSMCCFHSKTANDGISLVTGNQTVDIPKKSWLEFDEQQGTEKLWLVWSVNKHS